jgi:hypothetical protein
VPIGERPVVVGEDTAAREEPRETT